MRLGPGRVRPTERAGGLAVWLAGGLAGSGLLLCDDGDKESSCPLIALDSRRMAGHDGRTWNRFLAARLRTSRPGWRGRPRPRRRVHFRIGGDPWILSDI